MPEGDGAVYSISAVVVGLEASPSLVYGAALLMRLGVTPPPGFKSRSLRWDPVRRVPGLAC